jgi:hypothetical protein
VHLRVLDSAARSSWQEPDLNPSWSYDKRAQDFVIKCDFKGQLHVPVWATPACIALVFVGCLLGCWFKRRELVHTVRSLRGASHASAHAVKHHPICCVHPCEKPAFVAPVDCRLNTRTDTTRRQLGKDDLVVGFSRKQLRLPVRCNLSRLL